MLKYCFKKTNTNPPVCAVHDVALVLHLIAIDLNAPGLGKIACYRCSVTGAVVPDGKTKSAVKFDRTHRAIAV